MEQRKQAERDFANLKRGEALQNDSEQYTYYNSNRRFYSIIRRSRVFAENWLRNHSKNKRVLDYGCGTGQMTLECAGSHAKEVVGIDISDVTIESNRRRAAELGYSHVRYEVMDAEHTDFPDSYFDVIVVNGVLHHLDLQYAYPELARILTPDGAIICTEALVHNPLIQAYRRRTPHLRTAWEVDHILGRSSVLLSQRYFNGLDKHFFHLATLLAVPFRNTRFFRPLLTLLEYADRGLLSLPGIQWQAWILVFVLSKPRKQV